MRGKCNNCIHWQVVARDDSILIGETVYVCTYYPPMPALVPQPDPASPGGVRWGTAAIRPPTRVQDECSKWEEKVTIQ